MESPENKDDFKKLLITREGDFAYFKSSDDSYQGVYKFECTVYVFDGTSAYDMDCDFTSEGKFDTRSKYSSLDLFCLGDE